MVTGNTCVIILGKLILKMGESKTKTDPQILFKSNDPNKMHCWERHGRISLFSTTPIPTFFYTSTLSPSFSFKIYVHVSFWMTNFCYHYRMPVFQTLLGFSEPMETSKYHELELFLKKNKETLLA